MEAAVWPQAYVEGYRRVGGVLMGIRRRGERANACLKVLIDAAASLTSRAPSAIDAPSAEHAIALAEIAGAAAAAHSVIEHGEANLNLTADSRLLDSLARRSAPWGGQFAPGLMAASDGEMRTLLHEGAVSELEAGLQAGRPADANWLIQPAYRIGNAAMFLAALNATARARPAGVHLERAEALDQQIASAPAIQTSHSSAHAFAVHHLTGIYGPGDSAMRTTMLRFVATHPPHERATLQASKVGALMSGAQGPRTRMALLDHIIILLGPAGGDPSIRTALARDSALVLLMLDTDAVEHPDVSSTALPVAQTSVAARSPSPEHGPGHAPPIHSGRSVLDAKPGGIDAIAEIAREAERAIAAATGERQAWYQRAVEADSLADALAIVRDAAADDDHEQAWLLLEDIARRHPEADPNDLVTIAPDVLGPVALDSDGDFDGPGAGCFTVLSPAPAAAAAAVARIAPRLLNVDDRGIEHHDSETARTAGFYTPNYLHAVAWCDRGAQVMLDTKGSISTAMARTMLAIITHALIDNRVPALVTGWIPALQPRMGRWDTED
jgi:hypothetical protein